MFGQPKNTFGPSNSFGGFNSSTTAASPFGFKPTGTTSAFGAAPAFGAAATPQQNTGGGLFGSPTTGGGLFGGGTATATPAPAFGSTGSGGFGFGQTASGGGLFGASTSSGGGLFGQQQAGTSAFGAKPAGFGFNNAATPSTGTGLFGASTSGGGLFGQQSTGMSGGGLFSGGGGGFGQQQQNAGTSLVKFNPLLGTDTVVKSGQTSTITIKHHCITCMKEYEGKSLEELRLEDYTAGRRGAAASGFGAGGSAFQSTADKPAGGLFGQTSAFGQPTTTGSSMFGSGALGSGGFGQTNTAFSFGGAASTNTTTPLFGAPKPAFGATSTTGLFGSTQATPAFGAATSTFGGFGATATQPQSTGLFGAKPTTGFGAAAQPATGGFGTFGSTTGGGIFGSKTTTAAPTFGSQTPAFGSLSGGGFGANTATSGGLFGQAAKPATSAFGFAQSQPTLGGGLPLSSNTFNQPKLGGSVFPSFSTGGNLSLNTQTQAQPIGGFGQGTLGGGLGGFGTMGSSGLGGLGGFGSTQGNTLSTGIGSSATNTSNVHEQILSLASHPYGDSPLFKDLPVNTGVTSEERMKPTNPAAVKAVLDKSNYRVSPPDVDRLTLRPLPNAPSRNKKSLFDGLEESDASVEERLSLKPSRKRLVLRLHQNHDGHNNRSTLDESHAESANSPVNVRSPADVRSRRVSFEDDLRGVNTDLEEKLEETERRSSWLGSRLSGGSPKARPSSLDTGGGSPRIYPDLDKELPVMESTRTSWLTTKPLQRAAGGITSGEGASQVESSVRELRAASALRPDLLRDDKENIDTAAPVELPCSATFCGHRVASAATSRCCKISHQIRVTEEENAGSQAASPHPAGVKLTRPGYYTIPSLQEMIGYMRADGSCRVPSLTIGRHNYGSIHYDTEIDVAGLDLDKLVHLMNKEVSVYEDESVKPPVGQGLNRRAIVTLERVWPRDKTARRLITEPDKLLKMDYEGKLRRVCDKHNTKFIEYRPETGSWVFRVEHFSKYGLTDSDEEEEAPDIIKRQLQPIATVGAASAVTVTSGQQLPLPPPHQAAGLGGSLSGLGGTSLLAATPLSLAGVASAQGLGGYAAAGDESMDGMTAVPYTSTRGGLAMDTSEENTMESQSLYPDAGSGLVTSGFGVKSPTGELARLDHRSSHRVQLMKASLYSDTLLHDMDDDVSVSTGDQLVPQPGSPLSLTRPAPSEQADEETVHAQLIAQEPAMRPLTVRPHTVVLRHHRRVPPFAHTIAGRLGAACIADMAVCRARHSRVGFGPGGRIALVTTHDRVSSLPSCGPLSSLERYVAGRGADDWSAYAVARLAVAGRDAAAHSKLFQEWMEPHLLSLLDHSERTSAEGDAAPRLTLKPEPASRLSLLQSHLRHVQQETRKLPDTQFGVSRDYWRSVWSLCRALWGEELAAAGVRGGRDASVLERQRALAAWLQDAVAGSVEQDDVAADDGDDSDAHSARVLSLLVCGRATEACRVARQHGDLNMAALIAQCAGDSCIRQLLLHQLESWRESGALRVISKRRTLALMLAAGLRQLDSGAGTLDVCAGLDWLRAFNVHHRYLCPQVVTVEEAVRSYEAMFRRGDAEEECDLAALPDEPPGLSYPVPEYHRDYELTVESGGVSRRVLDLRYELLRARARDTRPNVQPATYTPDPLDYSLSFVLGAWLGNVSVAAVSGLADQLEAAGAWHLAALVLLFHPNDSARGALVRGVISRHAPARADSADAEARLSFLRRLGVPQRWVLLARAHRAKYEGAWGLEAEHLAGAGEWNAAHAVLLDKLLPDAVLSGDVGRLSPLVSRLAEAAECERVAGWESGGRALHHYLHVCNEIRGLVTEGGAETEAEARRRSALHAALEALRPRVAAACRTLGALPTPTRRHAAARAEMGERLLQLAVCAGATPHQLTVLLQSLRMPQDCRRSVLHKITTELAEQASESCAASAECSPVSSHARALATTAHE